MRNFARMTLAASFALSTAMAFASPALTAKAVETRSDTTQAKSKKKKLATTLPAYKGKTKVALDFEKPPAHLANQRPSPLNLSLDQAIREQSAAEKSAQANLKKPVEVKAVISEPSRVENVREETSRAEVSRVEAQRVETPTAKETTKLSDEDYSFDETSAISVDSLTFEPKRHLPKKLEPKLLDDSSLTGDTESASTQPVSTAQRIRDEMTKPKKEVDLRDGSWRFVLRSGYLHAPYSQFEKRLQDGASHLAFGLSHSYGNLEIRSLLEIGHGMDQKINIQNTRYVMMRGEAAWVFTPKSHVQPFVSGSLALGHFSVRSYRRLTGDEMVLKRHAEMEALGVAPGGGFRFGLFKGAALDLTLEYLALSGASGAKSLGGLNMALGFSRTF